MSTSTIHGKVGIAISTTGDDHRLGHLQRALSYWEIYSPEDSTMIVTVDGDNAAVHRVSQAMAGWRGVAIYRVGQPHNRSSTVPRNSRLGVAANKNTGLDLLMQREAVHLFLSDDDISPLNPQALDLHAGLGRVGHSMVNWGGHRLIPSATPDPLWTWPRGSMLYIRDQILERVGGMVEAFGPGGHEHVEWSRRIHQHGYTPQPYHAPIEYAAIARNRGRASGAAAYWHAEDMPRLNEGRASLLSRRRALTSVRREPGDWPHIEALMTAQDGNTSFVPYTAHENQRDSATLYQNR